MNSRLRPLWTDETGYEPFAMPGGYPIAYITSDGEQQCAECATATEWNRSDGQQIDYYPVDFEILYDSEDAAFMPCSDCYQLIDPARRPKI